MIYSFVNAIEAKDEKNRKIFLLKLRNNSENSKWNGDWCQNSVYWNDFIKKQIPKEIIELNEGEFSCA